MRRRDGNTAVHRIKCNNNERVANRAVRAIDRKKYRRIYWQRFAEVFEMALASRAIQEEVVGANRDDVFFANTSCQREKGQINGSNESRSIIANDALVPEHHTVKFVQRVILPFQMMQQSRMAHMSRVQMIMCVVFDVNGQWQKIISY